MLLMGSEFPTSVIALATLRTPSVK